MYDQEYFKEMLLRLGPAFDEEGWLVRRQIVAALVTWATCPFLGEDLLCDPRTGHIADRELARISAALKAEIAGSEFEVVVDSDGSSHLSFDLLPQTFIHPLQRTVQASDIQRRVQAALDHPAYMHEGQD